MGWTSGLSPSLAAFLPQSLLPLKLIAATSSGVFWSCFYFPWTASFPPAGNLRGLYLHVLIFLMVFEVLRVKRGFSSPSCDTSRRAELSHFVADPDTMLDAQRDRHRRNRNAPAWRGLHKRRSWLQLLSLAEAPFLAAVFITCRSAIFGCSFYLLQKHRSWLQILSFAEAPFLVASFRVSFRSSFHDLPRIASYLHFLP